MPTPQASGDLEEEVLRRCRAMEIPLAGIAPVDRWRQPLFDPWIPKEFFPDAIFPETRSVLVIGLPVPLPVLETSPSIWYREQYHVVNSLLDQYTYRLAEFLNRRGYPSVFVPRDGYGSIDVLLEEMDEEQGEILLSKRKADRIRGWERIISTNKEGDTVSGLVTRTSPAGSWLRYGTGPGRADAPPPGRGAERGVYPLSASPSTRKARSASRRGSMGSSCTGWPVSRRCPHSTHSPGQSGSHRGAIGSARLIAATTSGRSSSSW